MEKENLVDRYVHEVGRHLPSRTRADLSLEIRSALGDLLEERGIDAEKDPEAVEALLREYGHPEQVAASYQPERWLVGPKLYPLFILVLKSVLAVVGGLTRVGFVISGATAGLSGEILWAFFSSLVDSALGILGILVVVFTVLERLGAGDDEDEEEWDPKSLPQVEDPDLAKRGDLLGSIAFSAGALMLFNLFPEWVAVYGSHDGEWGVIARLTPSFRAFIPWLSALWAIEIALSAEVLRQGRWSRFTRSVEVLHGAFGMFVLYRIVEDGPILTLAPLGWLVKGAITIVLVVMAIEWVGQVYRLLRNAIVPQRRMVIE